ncbi:hypothetical protein [Tenacibaculum maritimum]|uniref:Uncharacterized protein n=1 Tax=Tenacibaculum maritimum NCIMB 2154 TaxID=1349785 RepID=A0A2H1E919_9FLAO|nr:hypothetical protein [Tenacibaculum maritimum]SFZ81286.1 protein of unknown function [Tenacibaculum maritimum NCIMB 2154]
MPYLAGTTEESNVDTDVINDTTTGENTNTNTNDTDNSNTDTSNNSSSDSSTTNTTDTTNSNSGTNTTTDTNAIENGSTDTNNTTSSTTEKEVVIEHNGKSYKNKDIIEVPYSRELDLQTFELKNIDKDSNRIEWSLHKDFEAISAEKYLGKGERISTDVRDIGGAIVLQAAYWSSASSYTNGDSKKIRVLLKIPRKEFELEELVALHQGKRLAKSGEILYLLHPPTSYEDYKKVDYGIKISPRLKEKEIPKYHIQWSFDTNKNPEYYGKKTFTRNLRARDVKYVTSVHIGSPNKLEKSVDVKWVKRDYQKIKISLSPDNFYDKVTSENIKKVLEATKLVEKYGKKLESFSFIKSIPKSSPVGINWLYEIVPFESIAENKEDIKSRLYYREKKTKGGFKVALKGSVTVWKWGLPIKELPIPDWAVEKIEEYVTAEVKIEASADAFGEVKVVSEERKYVESNKWVEYKKSIDPAIIGLNVTFGARGEFSLLKNNNWFAISGYASGVAGAELLSIGDANGNFGVFPLRKGVYLDLNAGAYLVFLGKKLETSSYYERIQLIDPIKL